MDLKEAKEIVSNVFNKSDVDRYKEAQRVIAEAHVEAPVDVNPIENQVG